MIHETDLRKLRAQYADKIILNEDETIKLKGKIELINLLEEKNNDTINFTN